MICEYLEETQPGVLLHPVDPLTRARHRGWIEFGSSILSDLWGFETAKDADAYEAKRKALIDKFGRVEAELGEGPFFAGERFSLVDAVFAPIFRYFDVFDTITDTGVFTETPKGAGMARYASDTTECGGCGDGGLSHPVARFPDRSRRMVVETRSLTGPLPQVRSQGERLFEPTNRFLPARSQSRGLTIQDRSATDYHQGAAQAANGRDDRSRGWEGR